MIRFAFVADDFTGATDALWQFARHGLRARLFTTTEALLAADLTFVDVVGIATTARALATPELLAVVIPALEAVRGLDPVVVQYKVCSTFDSSPAVGSIGAVIDAVLARGSFVAPVPVAPAQPELGRFTAFGNHFARYRDDVYRLDRHLPMRTHPVTPVDEADLREHLARQTSSRIASLYLPDVESDALGDAYRSTGSEVVVLDAVNDEHLRRISEAVLATAGGRPVLAVGSGGMSSALAAVAGLRDETLGDSGSTPPADGAVLVAAGSLSPVTRRQIEEAGRQGWRCISAFAGSAEETIDEMVESLGAGRDTVVFSAPSGDGIISSDEVTRRLARCVAAALGAGIARVVVAGGDTSGTLVGALGVDCLEVVSLVQAGAPLCRVAMPGSSLDGLELVLKGGQVGGDGFFSVASGRQPSESVA